VSDDSECREQNLSDGERRELLAEYASLRTEILKRIEIRHQLNFILLTATAAILGVVTTANNFAVAMILPILVLFIAMSWVQNDYRVGQLGAHIRDYIEGPLRTISWETKIQEKRDERRGHWHWRRTVVAQAGVFILIQASSVILGSLDGEANLQFYPALVTVGSIAAALVLVIMVDALLRCEKIR